MNRCFFFVVILLLILPSKVFSAGFNCNYASTEIERAICANNVLSKLDDELNFLYNQLSKKYTKSQLRRIHDPDEFIGNRAKKCAAHEIDCLIRFYELKNSALKLNLVYGDVPSPNKPKALKLSNKISNGNGNVLDTAISRIKSSTGVSIDRAEILQLYRDFTNPNRRLEWYEKDDGFLTFGDHVKNLPLGKMVAEFQRISKRKSMCWKKQGCDDALANALYAFIAGSTMTATTNVSGFDKTRMIAKATIVLALYKNNPVNKTYKLYPRIIPTFDNELKRAIQWHNTFGKNEWILRLSPAEAGAVLIGGALIGIYALTELTDSVCGAGACSNYKSGGGDVFVLPKHTKRNACIPKRKACFRRCGNRPATDGTWKIYTSDSPRSRCQAKCPVC